MCAHGNANVLTFDRGTSKLGQGPACATVLVEIERWTGPRSADGGIRAAGDRRGCGVSDPALIDDLVAANRILSDHGVLDAYGHISARDPKNPQRYWLSRSMAPVLVTADDIIEFDLDSRPVRAGENRLFFERVIHGEIYKARPDVMAVVHNHSPSLIPFANSETRLRPMVGNAAFLGDGVPVFDIRTVDDEGDLNVCTVPQAAGAGARARRGMGGAAAPPRRGRGRRVDPRNASATPSSRNATRGSRSKRPCSGRSSSSPRARSHSRGAASRRTPTAAGQLWKQRAMGG